MSAGFRLRESIFQTSIIERAEEGLHCTYRRGFEHGRRLNLYCTGKGSLTVVFDSGGGDETIAWALVQPAIAARTQA